MTKENVILYFRLRKINKIKNYHLEELKHNDFMSVKHENCISAVNGFVSISVFVSLVDVAVGVTSSAVGLIIMQELQKLKSISQSWRKKENNMII